MMDGVHLWDLESRRELAHLPSGHTFDVLFPPGVGPGGLPKEVFSIGRDRSYPGLYRWPIRALAEGTGRLQCGPPERILSEGGESLSVSGDGATLAANIYGQGAKLAKGGPPPVVGELLRQSNANRVALSPDVRWLASSTLPGKGIRIWDARTGRPERDLAPGEEGTTVAFSPDGRWLVAGLATTYQFWCVPDWEPALAVPGCPRDTTIAFSPDGRMVALETAPARIRLLDPTTGQEFATLDDPHRHRPYWQQFSPDGTRLIVSASLPGALHVWDLRHLRSCLAASGLDWDLPPYSDAAPRPTEPCKIQLELTADFRYLKGAYHLLYKEFPQAICAFQETLAKDPHHANACNDLAWLYVMGPLELRDPAKALPLAEQAVRRESQPQTLNTLGVVHYRLGRWREAIDYLNRSAKGHAGAGLEAWDLFFLAMCYQGQGNRVQARTTYDRAVAARARLPRLLPASRAELDEIQNEAAIMLAQPGQAK
jgi:hypothetical protein